MKALVRPHAKKGVKGHTSRSRSDKPTTVYSLSQAKASLGRLVKRAEQGETILIARGRSCFSLQYVPPIEPIPNRPLGYFQFDAEDVALDGRFAQASVIPNPEAE